MSNGIVIHSKARKHPPYFEMVSDAIVTLKERNGSSQYAIQKFIQDKQKTLPANFKKMLLTQLKKLVAGHKLVKVKASYKLPSAPAKAKAKAAPKAKPAAKAKPAPKAKPTAKVARTSTRWMPGMKAPAKMAPKTSGRLITLEEIIKHFAEPMEEAAGILRG